MRSSRILVTGVKALFSKSNSFLLRSSFSLFSLFPDIFLEFHEKFPGSHPNYQATLATSKHQTRELHFFLSYVCLKVQQPAIHRSYMQLRESTRVCFLFNQSFSLNYFPARITTWHAVAYRMSISRTHCLVNSRIPKKANENSLAIITTKKKILIKFQNIKSFHFVVCILQLILSIKKNDSLEPNARHGMTDGRHKRSSYKFSA